MPGEALSAELRRRGIEAALAERLGAYGALVLTANRDVNLTGAREPAAFAEHIADALTLAGDIDGPLIDLGSGAGLPGIPLAIATGVPVVLVDAVRKKAAFLALALEALHLAGGAYAARAETLGRDPAFRGRFRCATARAVASAPTVTELALPFLEIGGRALLQRGSLDERERSAVADAAPMLGGEFIEERLLGGERRLLIVVKRTATAARFPRRDGVPEKRPLCFT